MARRLLNAISEWVTATGQRSVEIKWYVLNVTETIRAGIVAREV